MIFSDKLITKALISLRRLVCTLVVRTPPKTGFLAVRPNYKLVTFTKFSGHFRVISPNLTNGPSISVLIVRIDLGGGGCSENTVIFFFCSSLIRVFTVCSGLSV